MSIVTDIFLPIALAFIMFALGLGLTGADFLRVLKQPKDFFVGAISQIILLPIIAFILVKVWPISPELAIGVMIIAAAPGGVTSNILTSFARGDVALSISLTAVISLLSVLTVPFIIVTSLGLLGSENITLYAKWTSEPTFTVTYNANSADSGSVPTDSTNYLEGQTVIVANNTGNLARSSYSFNCCNTAADGSGTPRTANSTFSMGNANVTLYAQWTPVYTVTYNANSATSGSVPTDSNTYANGATVPVANNTGNLFRTGYTFNAWNTAADGSGTTRTEGSTFSMGSANVTLYAEWGATYSQQIGTSANDEGHDIAIDSSQNVFIVGHTFGALQGTFLR